MAYNAVILKDSKAPSGSRLVSFEVTFPRIVLAEFNTHKMISKNSASSRAIPVNKIIERVEQGPFIPIHWGKNQKGMQAEVELTQEEQEEAKIAWLEAKDQAVASAKKLLEIGVHKQITNRLMEPFMWHTVIATATEWENFFGLRTHKDAQPEIRKIALMMEELYRASTPKELKVFEYHLPLVNDYDELIKDGYTEDEICKISAGRCARVSYLTHNGTRDPKADIDLCEKLKSSAHLSPFEHIAMASNMNIQSGNLTGWVQYRKSIPGESIYKPK